MYSLDNFFRVIEDSGEAGYSVAKSTNIPKSSFTKWRMEHTKPSFDALLKIADYLNVSLDYLVGRDPVPNNNKSPRGGNG